MSSTISTPSAIGGALRTLLFSSTELQEAQLAASSGKRVAKAADNVGYWSTASALDSDMNVMKSVDEVLSLGESTIETAYMALNTVLTQLSDMRATLSTAYDTTIDRQKIAETIASQKSTISTTIQSASFAGTNWLLNGNSTLAGDNSIIASFQRTAGGAISTTSISIAAADTILVDSHDASRGLLTGSIDANTLNPDGSATARNYYLLDPGSATPASGVPVTVSATTTKAELDDMVDVVDTLLDEVNTLAARLGTMLNRVTSQSDYAKSLVDALDKSISRLVDTDMEEASARLAAAKTREALARNVLNIANSNQANIALLFS